MADTPPSIVGRGASAPFELERYSPSTSFGAPLVPCASDVEPFRLAEVLALALPLGFGRRSMPEALARLERFMGSRPARRAG